jgi:eukaryotic-like serine/threonine-protein kinase
MNSPTYWQRVEELFQAALDRAPGERAQFLFAACGANDQLRTEVASLLAAHEGEAALIDLPAPQLAAQLLSVNEPVSLSGQSIRQYRFLKLLGQGGMGEVWLAQDDKLQRQVAIKALTVNPLTATRGQSRLFNEAQAAARLDHPNVCTVYEMLEAEARCFIVMQYVEGETLAERLKRGRLPWHEAVEIAVQIADALVEAHAAGIIHRDIKPQNVMLNTRGVVKVLDFGIAQLNKDEGGRMKDEGGTTTSSFIPHPSSFRNPSSFRLHPSRTKPALIFGTPGYLAPEQAQGAAVDGRSDLFSLGVVLFEMLTGVAPFEAESPSEAIAKTLKAEPLPLAECLPEAPVELANLVKKALTKQPDERYQTAEALRDDLRLLQQATAFVVPPAGGGLNKQTLPPAGGTTNARRKWLLTAAMLLLLVLGGAGAWVMNQRPAEQPLDAIAVLPFSHTSEPEAAYLADGLTEGLINELTKLRELRVTPRSVVFDLPNQPLDVRQTGARLQVKALLTGRLTVRGDRLELQTELIEVAREAQLWGERYSRPVAELQALQHELLTTLITQLRPAQPGREAAQRHQTSPAAYDAYLQGQYALRQRLRGESGRAKPLAVEHFQRALALDEHYAPAWAGLAAAYARLTRDGALSGREGAAKVKEAALKALSLDDELPEAHLALADMYYAYEWNFAAAEREYKRYTELNDNDAQAWRSYAAFLTTMHRFAEAEAVLRRARALEAFSYANDLAWAQLLRDARRYEETIKYCQQTLKLHPQQLEIKAELAYAYLYTGQFEQAIRLREEMSKAAPSPAYTFRLAYFYAAAGRRDEADKVLAQYEAERKATGFVSHRYLYALARIHAVQGEADAAFSFLEAAVRERVVAMPGINTDAAFDKLRADPRFAELLRRVGFPP